MQMHYASTWRIELMFVKLFKMRFGPIKTRTYSTHNVIWVNQTTLHSHIYKKNTLNWLLYFY